MYPEFEPEDSGRRVSTIILCHILLRRLRWKYNFKIHLLLRRSRTFSSTFHVFPGGVSLYEKKYRLFRCISLFICLFPIVDIYIFFCFLDCRLSSNKCLLKRLTAAKLVIWMYVRLGWSLLVRFFFRFLYNIYSDSQLSRHDVIRFTFVLWSRDRGFAS